MAKAFIEPGWMKMKLRKEGMMRKVFILGERTKNNVRFLGRESGTRRDIHFRQRNDNCGLNQAITNQSIISRLSRTPVRTPAFAMHQLGSRFYNVSAISCGRELRQLEKEISSEINFLIAEYQQSRDAGCQCQ